MIEAGKQLRVVGRSKATYSKHFASFIIVEPDAIIMEPQKWEVDLRPVVIQRSRILRARPKFQDWSLEFNVVITDDEVPWEAVKQGLELAGHSIGIGDFRPGKRGPFGRFSVVQFQEIN